MTGGAQPHQIDPRHRGRRRGRRPRCALVLLGGGCRDLDPGCRGTFRRDRASDATRGAWGYAKGGVTCAGSRYSQTDPLLDRHERELPRHRDASACASCAPMSARRCLTFGRAPCRDLRGCPGAKPRMGRCEGPARPKARERPVRPSVLSRLARPRTQSGVPRRTQR